MKRMVTEEEIIKLIEEHAAPLDPSKIPDGDVSQTEIIGVDENDELVKGSLFGKYVRIITPPESTTLTEAQFELFKGGVFVNGTFLGVENPVFTPATLIEGSYFGIIIHGNKLGVYYINPDTRQIAKQDQLHFNNGVLNITSQNLGVGVSGFVNFRGKTIPSYKTSTKRWTFIQEIGGDLTWREGNGLYLHTVVFDVGAGQSFTIRLISDSSTTCALDAGTGNFTIPGSTFIQPANMGNVVIVPLDANKFAPDIYAFDSATGAFTDNITLASVTSDTVTPIG